MEEKQRNELTDEELDAAAGGVSRKNKEPKVTCLRCKEDKPTSQVLGGYCMQCRDELAKEGVFIPL